jgi:hypothetical protein
VTHDRDRHAALAEAGQKRASRFSRRVTAERTAQVYREVLSNG